MSKMDDLRAMREARYEQAAARAAKSAAKPPSATTAPRAMPEPNVVATPKAASTPASTPAPTVSSASAEPEEALCGHRAISGRTCTREAGHAAKSHRYA